MKKEISEQIEKLLFTHKVYDEMFKKMICTYLPCYYLL